MNDIYYQVHTKSNGTIVCDFNLVGPNTLTRGEQARFELHLPKSDDLTLTIDELIVSNSYTVPAGTTEQYSKVTVESGATLTVDGTLETAELVNNGTITGNGQVKVIDVVKTKSVASGTAEVYDEITVGQGYELIIDGILQGNSLDNNNGTVTVSSDGTLNLIGTESAFALLRQYGDFAGGFATIETENSTVKYREQIPSDHDVESILLGIEPAQNLEERNVTGIWGLVDSVNDTRPLALSDTRLELNITVLAEFPEYTDHADVANTLEV